ncbi:MAG: aconitate hydratase B, partial [Gammaproteobacteria bacterium]|nr:aconitate hydratase B [Gammaproteobacteria bacterium]
MLESYRQHVAEREAEDLPPLALDANQVAELIELIKHCPKGEEDVVMDLLVHRVPPGVDQAAYVKAAFLADVAKGGTKCDLIDAVRATEILGTMLGGYNIQPLIDLLDSDTTADAAATALSHTLLIYDAFHDIADKAKDNVAAAR